VVQPQDYEADQRLAPAPPAPHLLQEPVHPIGPLDAIVRLDNVFVVLLWRSVKHEDIYIKDYDRVGELEAGLAAYFRFYDEERPHQAPGYRTPGEVYRAGLAQANRGEGP
jgi:hypothetical protein